MTKSYRVFTFAPLASASGNPPSNAWITASSRAASPPLPPATLDKAAHQISLFYQNVIFEEDEEENDASGEWESCGERPDPTIEWPPTNPADASTYLNITEIDVSRVEETFNTALTGDETTMQSEGSSISRFPVFNFSLNVLSSLSAIIQAHRRGTASSKVTVLLGVLEVDGPSYVTPKTGAYSGSEIALLKLIVGDEHGTLCKLVAWRETAELWGGIETGPGLTRGDIVLFENVLVSGAPLRQHDHDRLDSVAKAQITASPNLKSNAEICYRTLPRTHADRKWRPDLRLADSVPAVRKVSEVVNWMERMAGISAR